MNRRRSLGVPFFYPDWLELREVTSATVRSLRAHATGDVLDVGCGEMPYREFAPEGTTWTGLDVEDNASADLHGSADHIPARDASFQTVLCTQVLEHVPDPVAVLRETRRVLCPGGILILTAPQYWEAHEEPHDYYRYTVHGLRRLLEDSGFDVVEHEAQGVGAALACQSLNLAILHAGDSGIARALPFRLAKFPLYFLVNVVGVILSRVLRNPRDAMNHLFVARSRP